MNPTKMKNDTQMFECMNKDSRTSLDETWKILGHILGFIKLANTYYLGGY
jgi:hypothetical protein